MEKEKCFFKGRMGSYAYGTNVEGSDIDIREIYIESLSEMILPKEIWEIEEKEKKKEVDFVSYSLRKFSVMVFRGSATILEFLGDGDFTLFSSEGYEKLKKNRNLFLDRQAVSSFVGYSLNQLNLYEKRGNAKSLMHSLRAMRMAKEISEDKNLFTSRKNIDQEELLSIRKKEISPELVKKEVLAIKEKIKYPEINEEKRDFLLSFLTEQLIKNNIYK